MDAYPHILFKCGFLYPTNSVRRKNGLLSLFNEANGLYHDSEELVKLLILNGADVNARTRCGVTPLFSAAGKSAINVVRLLLKNGADVNAVSDYGTALHCASTVNSEDNIRVLLEYGADINISYGGNIVPIDCAVMGSLVGAEFYYHCPGKPYIINDSAYDVLLRRIIKMKVAGLFVNEANLDYVGPKAYFNLDNPETKEDDELNFILSEYPQKCEKEMALLKNEKVGASDFSYYGVLKADNQQLINFSGNKAIVEVLSSGFYKEHFPIYACMIESNFMYGEKRRELVEKTDKIFRSVFVNLPQLCIDKIISYLTNCDLLKLCDLCQSSSIGSSVFP